MLYLIMIAFICFACPVIPFCLFKMHLIIYYGILDIYKYFRYKRWHEFKRYGKIMCYCGLFGAGKTLSMTHFVRSLYNQYNNQEVYDFENKKWVIQHIHIISNYALHDIPYTPLVCEEQLYNIVQPKQDITIVLLDEISAIFNNRDYKNFTPDLLTSLLQCRHRKVMFLGTAQRFQMTDKNFRQTMETSSNCKKFWRICRVNLLDAYELENCTNPLMLKPIARQYWFVRDSDYYAYDTNEMVTKLVKNAKEGKLLTSPEITAKQGDTVSDIGFATGIKRRFRKKQ